MRRMNRLCTESIETMQTNNKSLQYFTLCMLTTHYLLIAALSPAALDDCQSPRTALPYSEHSWRRGCTPFAEGAPHISPFQEIIGTKLFSIFLASKPCHPSLSAEEKMTKTEGPSSFLRLTVGRQEALVMKQSKRLPSLA